LERSRVSLEIELGPERVEEALERAYRKVVRRVTIPGFRKGKVPRRILELRLGPEVLYDDAIEDLVSTAYAEAIKETAVVPVAPPDVDVLERSEEHTSELQSRENLVCRLLLEKKNNI